MQKTSRRSTSRRARLSVIWVSAIASTAALLSSGGCASENLGGPGPLGTGSGAGSGGLLGSGGASNRGGSAPAASGGATSASGAPGSGGAVSSSGGASSGGVVSSSGGLGSGGTVGGGGGLGNGGMATGGLSGGGMGSGGLGSGGMATGGKACVDVEPPPDPEWPGATCLDWATTTPECDAAWFAGFCDVSCGRCVPEGGTTGGAAGVDCSGEGLPNVTGGDGFSTRYWDCCQPHCAQFDGHRCGQDGVSGTGDTTSSCSGGGSFACYDEAPRAVSDCLSYGHTAKANPNCGACYRIQFTGEGQHNANDPGSKLIKGKQMIVKVTNTGGDVAGNQFDLMIPGGGVGMYNGCSRQWGTSDLGEQFGGFLADCTGSHADKKDCVRRECMKIPAGAARDGCIWFVDWFEVADNPKFTSQQTDCPF